MGWGVFKRNRWIPLSVAVVSLGVALAAGWSLAGNISDARRIDASPIRVHGIIDQVVPVKGGTEFRVSYQVGGKRFATKALPVGSVLDRANPKVGTAVCLEASSQHPEKVRLCGQKYPGGDDMVPTEGLVVVAGAMGALIAAGWILMVARQERRDNHRSGPAAQTA
jgi:hypothetical protein